MARRKNKQAETPEELRFRVQCIFNSGYWHGVQCHREGWNNPEKNYGFARGGMPDMKSEGDVIRFHFNRTYARGYLEGLHDSKCGQVVELKNGSSSSSVAFGKCVADGEIIELPQ